jgi:hypothetical protein
MLAILPSTLVVFGLVVSLLLVGESVLDAAAMPVALAYAVPGLLSGFGMAIIYKQGFLPAVTVSKRVFGRFLSLALMPLTGAVFGVVASLWLIDGGSHPVGLLPFGPETTWLAAGLSMVGGLGGPVGAWLAASEWDFRTAETRPKALSKSTGGSMLTAVCFALVMAVLGQWLIVLLLVLYFGVILAVGVALFMRARRKRPEAMKPS